MPLYPKNMHFTSESATEGHPDKFCDLVADAVVDECLKRDAASRVACDAFLSMGMLVVGGEVTTRAEFDLDLLVRDLGTRVGYTSSASGFDINACTIARSTCQQPPDAKSALRRAHPGSQAVVVGYACNQTPEMMPLPIALARRLASRLSDVRKKEILPFLGPDGRTQVSVEYRDGKPARVSSVVVSLQHSSDVLARDGQSITEDAKQGIVSKVVTPVLGALVDRRTRIVVNGAGRLTAGGRHASCGATGRQAAADGYGGWVAAGGTLSGRDPGRVERAAGYMTRCVAKNVVAAGLGDECFVQLAYGAGEADPVSVTVTTLGSGTLADDTLSKLVRQVFPLSPKAIVDHLGLAQVSYRETAVYGQFGRADLDLAWERTQAADELLAALMKA